MGSIRVTGGDAEAARRIAATRWPDGIQCPFCDSSQVSERNRPGRRWPQWRCRDCRKDFTAVTGTALHGTRRAPSEIELQGPAIPKMLNQLVSDGATEQTEEHPDANAGLGAAASNVMNALRQRPDGATVAKVADIAGLSDRHTRRTLRQLSHAGLVHVRDGTIRDGHRTLNKALWSLTYSPECVSLLGCLRRRPAAMPEVAVVGAVPPQFWHLFWSGSEGSEVALPRDEEHIAGTLIGSRDLSAEAWALRHVSSETLGIMTEMRGYDSGDVCTLIRSELNRRASVAA